MKVAVTSQGRDLEAKVDPRFGRAAFILVVDTETLDFEVLDNKANVDAFKGAGIQAAAMVSQKGAQVLLTGYCGPNAYKTLKAANIKVASDATGTVAEAIKTFEAGDVVYAQEANTDGHW